MANMTDGYWIAAFANYLLAGASAPAVTITTPLHLRLMTAVSSGSPANNNGSNGTEMTTEYGYTALGASMGSSPTFTSVTSTALAQMTNSTAVSWGATGTWPTINGIEIWDTEATPKRILQGGITPITGVVSGDTVQFPVAAIAANPADW